MPPELPRFDSLPASVATDVTGLVEVYKEADPKLYCAILLLNEQVEKITLALDPLIRPEVFLSTPGPPPVAPVSLSVFMTGNVLGFEWPAVVGARQYELREGLVWETASFVGRTTETRLIIEATLIGTYNYLLKTIDISGAYSTTTASLVVVIPPVPAPILNHQVIDNNVILSWNYPFAMFRINYFIVSRNGTEFARISSNFITFFETVNGSYIYSVKAVDIAGNIGIEGLVTVQVNAPPDFAIQDTRISTLLGTRVNVLLLTDPSRLLCSWLASTFQDHFTSNAWMTPANQVAALFPVYIQPATLLGSYEEVFDYGIIISNIITTVTWNVHPISISAVTVLVQMAFSDDDITYTAFTSGSGQFSSHYRYLKLRLEFTGADTKAMIELSNLTITLNVKRENDGGEVSALYTDVGGTTVNFSKSFKDVESITVSVKSVTEPFRAIFDFNDIPNPTFFKVFVFDTTGNRVSKVVDWKARGIV